MTVELVDVALKLKCIVDKIKLTLYKLLLSFQLSLEQLYISNKTEYISFGCTLLLPG